MSMPPPRIKICGLNSKASVDCAVSAGADYLGFIHFSNSPRHLPVKQIGELVKQKGKAKSVIVLVNPNTNLLKSIAETVQPDFIQLHGDETPQLCEQARRYARLGIWKALGVSDKSDLERAAYYEDSVNGFVFDAKPPALANRPGGLGLSWDYSLLADFNTAQPWFLAGGLTVKSVSEALIKSNAPGVDAVSGIESAPGVKDLDKISDFIATVKAIKRSFKSPEHQSRILPTKDLK